MKATSFYSSISANLGNSGEAMVEIHKFRSSNEELWPPHFRTFCELVENKLTTFSTWTIMNESNIIFQQQCSTHIHVHVILTKFRNVQKFQKYCCAR